MEFLVGVDDFVELVGGEGVDFVTSDLDVGDGGFFVGREADAVEENIVLDVEHREDVGVLAAEDNTPFLVDKVDLHGGEFAELAVGHHEDLVMALHAFGGGQVDAEELVLKDEDVVVGARHEDGACCDLGVFVLFLGGFCFGGFVGGLAGGFLFGFLLDDHFGIVVFQVQGFYL